jgi:hypothetical protein
MGFPLAAPNGPSQIGESAPAIDTQFTTPLIVDAGRFFHVILQIPIGSATASQIFRGNVYINAIFE